MKIKEVEEQIGITKANIRYSEKEGLLDPKRDRENNYRECFCYYGENGSFRL